MGKLLLCTLLLTLQTSCATPPPRTPAAISPCEITDPGPAPQLHPIPCAQGSATADCLSIDETVALARWIHAVGEEARDLARCALVTRVPVGSAAFLAGKVEATAPTTTYDVTPLMPVIEFYRDKFGIQPTLRAMTCGEINAMYSQSTDTITLCRELLEAEPAAVVRFVLAHEMAHATMRSLGIPNDEASADELGTLVELELEPGDVWAAAEWLSDGEEPTPGDPHPSNLSRAQMMVCLADGHEDKPASPHCEIYYKRTVRLWTKLLVVGRKLAMESARD